MTLIVELVGLPASGKSTVKSQLEFALARAGVSIYTHPLAQRWRVFRPTGAFLRRPGAVLAFVRALLSDSRSIAQRVRAFRWFGATLGIYHDVGRSGGASDVLVLAEGVAQRAFLAFVDAKTAKVSPHMSAYLANIPIPHIAVHLRIDPVESVRRQQSRRIVEAGVRKADRLNLARDQLLALMEIGDVFLSQVVDALATQHAVEVHQLDTSDLDVAIAGLEDRVVPAVLFRSQIH